MSELKLKTVNLGGWTIRAAAGELNPPDYPSGLEDYLKGLPLGVDVKPLILLAEQVVNGTNYMLLCDVVLLQNPVVRTLSKVVVHLGPKEKGAERKYRITGQEVLFEQGLIGSFTLHFDYNAVPEKVASAFPATLLGATYKPIAYVGEQLVNGKNHMVLCEQTLSTKDADTHLAMMVLHDSEPDNIAIGVTTVSINRLV